MNVATAEKRRTDVLLFIYQNKAVLIRHIERMFFNTYDAAKKYLRELEKSGHLNSIKIYLTGEKAYFLTYKTIVELQGQGLDVDRYKVNARELEHDLRVIDILIYFIKNYKGLKSYKTDYFLRKERSKEQQRYRVPDFTIEDEDGPALIEYQAVDRNRIQIGQYVEDYKSYWPGYSVIFIVPAGKVNLFYEVCSANMKNFHICTFSDEEGLKIIREG
jgi:hypothetical protein